MNKRWKLTKTVVKLEPIQVWPRVIAEGSEDSIMALAKTYGYTGARWYHNQYMMRWSVGGVWYEVESFTVGCDYTLTYPPARQPAEYDKDAERERREAARETESYLSRQMGNYA